MRNQRNHIFDTQGTGAHSLHSFGMTYAGVRTKHVGAMKEFAKCVLGYTLTQDDGDFVAFTTPQGQRFELHGEETPDKLFYPSNGAVVGFEVSDMDTAVARARASGFQIIPEGVGEGDGGVRWCHFLGPDGNVYEFVHHPSIGSREAE